MTTSNSNGSEPHVPDTSSGSPTPVSGPPAAAGSGASGNEGTTPGTEKSIDEIKNKAEELFGLIKENAGPLFNDLKAKVEPIIAEIREKAPQYAQQAKDKAGPLAQQLKEKATPLIEDVQSKIGEARGKSTEPPAAASDPETQRDAVDPIKPDASSDEPKS